MSLARWYHVAALRIRSLARRQQVEEELNEELQYHLEELRRVYVTRGLAPEDARRAAARAMGGIDALKEQCRDTRGLTLVESLVSDLRHAARSLRRTPGFTAIAVGSVAIGIGATTTIFTIANALLWRPVPAAMQPERLVDIGRTDAGQGFDTSSYPNFLDVRQRVTLLEDVFAYRDVETVSLGRPDGAERLDISLVSGNYFDVLGTPAHVGRVLRPTDDAGGHSSRVVVIGHRLWRQRFNADLTLVGSSITLSGRPFVVVGVAAEDFRGTTVLAPQAWVPIVSLADVAPGRHAERLRERASTWLFLGGRLKPGVSVGAAQAEATSVARALEREYPEANGGKGLRVERTSLAPSATRYVVAFMALLMAIASVVLLIACANLAGVLLARGADRRQEIAIRLAIGASRFRVVRQLLTETLVLFVLAALLGVALARLGIALLVALLPTLPFSLDLSLPFDTRVLGFTLTVSFVAAVVCGLLPALHAVRFAMVTTLKEDLSAGLRRSRLRHGLLIGQLALSLVLVVCAVVLTRALQRTGAADVGFDATGVELSALDLSLARYTDVTGASLLDELSDRVRHISGVRAVAVAATLPLGSSSMSLGPLGLPGQTPQGALALDWNIVSPGYFSTMRIPLVGGRDFDQSDRRDGRSVLIVNETAARRFWPAADPVGQTLWRQGFDGRVETFTVVGVARDSKYRTAGESPRPFAYAPLHQQYRPRLSLVTRTEGARRMSAEVRRVVADLDSTLPVLSAQTMDEHAAFSTVPQRVAVAVAASLGVVSLLLATLGIYGVSAYAVSRRTREIGIRVAVGASRSDVLVLVLRQALVLTAVGVVIGVVLAVAAVQALSASFVGISASPIEPTTFLGVTLLFLLAALAASFVPARRALRIVPTVALRVL